VPNVKLGVKGWLVDSVQRLVFNLNVSNRLQPTGGGVEGWLVGSVPKVVFRVEAGYINLSLILDIGCLLEPRCHSLGW
jgi:hypothetical protein